MLINTNALNALRAQGAMPDTNDANLTIPNVGIIPIFARVPMRALDAAPGSATEGAAYSFTVWIDDLTGPNTGSHTVNMGYLAPGLWDLAAQFSQVTDFSIAVPANCPKTGIYMIQPPATLVSPLLSWLYPTTGYTVMAPIVIQLDTITQIVAVIVTTVAAQNVRTIASINANRLL